MPTTVTAYRVFVASPGGLQAERDAFRSAIIEHNESHGIDRGVMFIPVGWEDTLGGIGRPQHIINQELRQCDYFVMVLSERWGSSTQAAEEGSYTSGSHEEFGVARECHEKGTMRQLVLFFKDIEQEKLTDPGPQLKKVLDFKKELESEKRFLFDRFDEVAEFEKRLRRYLARWVFEHEYGQAAAPVPPAVVREDVPDVSLEAPTGAPAAPEPQVVQAEALARGGHIVEAETLLAKVVREDQLDSLNRSAGLLLQFGKTGDAEKVWTRLRDLARQKGASEWEVAAQSNLGKLYAAQGRHTEAEVSLRSALALRENNLGPNHPDVAVSLNLLAELYVTQRRASEAEKLLRRALAIQGVAIAS